MQIYIFQHIKRQGIHRRLGLTTHNITSLISNAAWGAVVPGGRGQVPPGDDHLLLDVGQEVRVVLAGQVQTLPVQTQDPQAVEHVEQDVGLLELGHFLSRGEEDAGHPAVT